ncbi:MAG: undecaprenyl/decaprenyl-phosphate alpha-N-acetylglucosaminyl 1-phosphate transferase [Thermoleophilia bacterium]|nr:undecaprenyl/decaprenyl-phosphate alpha-N-acetylglucosaminyl 1-phosphate transferase [Thermoleophilia bacterium]
MRQLFDTAYHDAWWAFLLAAGISFALMPLIRLVALRVGATAPTDERRVQDAPTPQVGGVGIVLALLIATVVFVDWRGDIFGLGRLNQHQLEVTLGCAALVALLGFVDDLIDLPWRAKLLGQVTIAVAAVVGPLYHLPEGLTHAQLPLVVNAIDLPFVSPFDLPIVLGVSITVVWIVAVMNMLNFIDGVDGLAGGQVAIIGATFAIVAASYDRLGVAILAAATSGAALGFLPHNWRRGGARIFMGDSGSLTLGFLIATISVQGVLKTTAAISLVIPLALLAVPIIDTSFVVLKRLRHGVSIASPDRWHLHHRLLNIGLSPRRVAATLWAWTASMSAVTLALRFVDYGNSKHWRPEGLLVLGFVTAGAVTITIFLAVRLEIIKSSRVRERNRRIAEQRAAEREVEADAAPPAGDER